MTVFAPVGWSFQSVLETYRRVRGIVWAAPERVIELGAVCSRPLVCFPLLAASAEEIPPRAGPQLRHGRPGAGIIHKVPRPYWPSPGQVSWDMYSTANTAVAHVSWLVDAPMNNPEEGRDDAKVSSVL